VLICTAGRGWASLGGDEFAVDPGNALVLARGQEHSYRADPADPWSIWWCHVTGPAASDLVEVITARLDRPLVGLSSPERAAGLVRDIIVALEADTGDAGMIGASGAGYALLALLAVERRSPRPGDPLHRAMDYLAAHLSDNVRVEDVAEAAGVSSSHLGALFRAATGGGTIEFHSRARMARARALLDSTSLPVSTIARELGFSDPLYFSRRFHARHGMSPSEYRRIGKG
jgi:AraC-like DNA-binding protein